ncbi:MAG: helix-turn-helix transcriptional regulator [Lachnospiraceae bacterium]
MNSNTHAIEVLKRLRKESGISQGEMAAYLNVQPGMMKKIEDGTQTLNTDMIEAIYYLFGESSTFALSNTAFITHDLEVDDMKAIAMMNKLAMNIKFMNKLLDGKVILQEQ